MKIVFYKFYRFFRIQLEKTSIFQQNKDEHSFYLVLFLKFIFYAHQAELGKVYVHLVLSG